MFSISTHDTTRNILSGLSQDLEYAAMSLDLDRSQETYLINLSNTALDSLERMNIMLETNFQAIDDSIVSIKSTLNRKSHVIKSKEAPDNGDDVELF